MKTGPTDEENLYEAILSLKTVAECKAFFTDLCTPGEIASFKERWKIACLLHKGDASYRKIAEETGASLATITRVARFLNQENYKGHEMVLNRIDKKD